MSDLTFTRLIDGFSKLEAKSRDRVVRIDMTIEDFEGLRRSESFRDSLDVVTQHDLLTRGLIGSVYGAQVYVDRENEETILTSEHGENCRIDEIPEPKRSVLENIKMKFITGKIPWH